MNIEADIRNLGKWLNEEQTAPIDRQALARLLAWAQMADKPAAWVYPEFFEGIAKAGCWTAYAGDGFGQHPDGVERFPLYRGPWPARPQEPTVEDNSQDWRGMDGTTAYWLIQRHADGWPDIGKMMGEWLDANRAQPAQPQKPLTGGDERRHIICLCPDCTKPAQQQEPVALDVTIEGDAAKLLASMLEPVLDDEPTPIRLLVGKGHSGHGLYVAAAEYQEEGAALLVNTSPPASKPDFKAFKEWAEAAGYDTAHTHDGIKWFCLNPMTADLWKAWQAAHAKGDA